MAYALSTWMCRITLFATFLLFLSALPCSYHSPDGHPMMTTHTTSVPETHHAPSRSPVHQRFAVDGVRRTRSTWDANGDRLLSRLGVARALVGNSKSLEVEALLVFKAAVTKDPQGALSDWYANDSNVCGWTGVVCSPNYPNIISLDLHSLGLEGALNLVLQQVGYLSFLEQLDLSNNSLSGSIPGNLLANCSKMSILALSYNRLGGVIPWQLGEIASLWALELSNNNLTGEIPSSIGNCSFLRYVFLEVNNLRGSIPSEFGGLVELIGLFVGYNILLGGLLQPELGQLVNLEELSVSFCNFNGPFPGWIANLTLLFLLDLSFNFFSGEIAKEIGHLPSLSILLLNSNQLTGKIPNSITNLTDLQKFSAVSNLLTDEIPVRLGLLSNLRILALYENDFTGTIPSSIGNCSLLTEFRVGMPTYNTVDGFLPSEKLMDPQALPLWTGNFVNLEVLTLLNVNLQGEIPKVLGNLSQIKKIELGLNNLRGEIPAFLTNLTSLTFLSLFANQLRGKIHLEIGLLQRLQCLYLDHNWLTGSLPKSLANMTQISVLSFMLNQLVGGIDEGVGRLWRMKTFQAGWNYFSGPLPLTLRNWSMLTSLNFERNRLRGTIPPGFANMASLVELNLGYNLLEGTIPTELMWCRELVVLRLDANMLEGPISFQIGQLYFLEELYLGKNNLSGTLPSSIGNCVGIRMLDLSDNRFVGSLPGSSISKMASALMFLDLSNNLFTGLWPEAFSELTNIWLINVSANNISGSIGKLGTYVALRWLDISINNFTGAIPSDMSTIRELRYFNASYNNFEGPIPHFNITLNESSFLGNPRLCGSIVHRNCTVQRYDIGSNLTSKVCEGMKCKDIWIPIASSVIGFFVIVGGVLCWMSISRKDDKTNFQHVMMNFASHTRFSERDVLKIIGDDENIIGGGAKSVVYKGTSYEGEMFAIKMLRSSLGNDNDEQQRDCELLKEVNILAKLRHRNILKVVSFCSTLDVKAMILEYMPQGSLHNHLYDKQECELAWEKRFNIALGVVHGMVYLHHGFPEPIIHRDLKPSNILLDANLEPKVSDFGVSKFVNPQRPREGEVTASTFCGTAGYLPPEYGMETQISTKGDVYSYGIVLLELLTRRRPIFDSDSGLHGNLLSWVREHFEENPLTVLDQALLNESTLNSHTKEKMVLLLRVALLCTRETRHNRPSMKDVLGMFRQIEEVGLEIIPRTVEDLAKEITNWSQQDVHIALPSSS